MTYGVLIHLLPEDPITALLTVVIAAMLLIFIIKIVHFIDLRRRIGMTSIDTKEEIFRGIEMAIRQEFEKHLELIRLFTSISPLAGLLGTLLGMKVAATGMLQNQATSRITGFSLSVDCTAAGIVTAIIGLLLHSIIVSMKKSLLRSLSDQANHGFPIPVLERSDDDHTVEESPMVTLERRDSQIPENGSSTSASETA